MNKRTQALLKLLSSMLIFGTIGLVRRGLSLSSTLLACFRGLFGAGFLAAFVKLRYGRVFHPMRTSKRLLLIAAGVMIGMNWIFLFEAYNYTSIATATLCYYMSPVMMILLSPLFFHEAITPRKAVCVGIAFVGMILVNGNELFSASGQLTGALFGLAAAFLYTMAVITTKKVPEADPFDKTVTSLFAAGAVLLPYLLIKEGALASWNVLTSLSAESFALLLTLGIVHTGLAYALYFGSQKELSVQTMAIFSYVDPVFAVILSALVLHEPMTPLAIFGAVLILGGAVASEIMPASNRKSESAKLL